MLPLQDLGARVRALRVAQGLTAKQLASAAGVHANTVLNFELGKANLELGNFLAICDALEVAILLTPTAIAESVAASNAGELRLTLLQRRLNEMNGSPPDRKGRK